MLRKTISIMEITWLAIVYLRNGTFHRLAFLKQYKQYCFWSVLTTKSGLWNVKMEAFLVWLPKKDHSNYPAFLFLTLPTLNGCKFERWIQLKNNDFKKLHWKDLELATKYREDQDLFPLAGEWEAEVGWHALAGQRQQAGHSARTHPDAHHGEANKGPSSPAWDFPISAAQSTTTTMHTHPLFWPVTFCLNAPLTSNFTCYPAKFLSWTATGVSNWSWRGLVPLQR